MGSKFWLVFGLIAQSMFFSRFLLQWVVSEHRGISVVPVGFWYLSLIGSLMLLSYAIHIKDIVFILGQTTGSIVYIRNLMLIRRQKAG
jgi:lipid-A-disaccharide synthase-like uncharacterized protein